MSKNCAQRNIIVFEAKGRPIPVYIYLCAFLFLISSSGISFADGFSGSIAAEGWYAWWLPYTSRDEEKGVYTKYQIDPAFLYGYTVEMKSEGNGAYALQYLTSQLEGEIQSKAVQTERDKILFDKFLQWRGDVYQRMSDEKYLYTKLIYGAFNGKAIMTTPTATASSQEMDVNSRYVVADLQWMKFTVDRVLVGVGLRLMDYQIPAVNYTISNNVITDKKFTDTSFRSYALALGVLDGSHVRSDGQSPKIPIIVYMDDVILYLGYAESDNAVMGRAGGYTVGMEGNGGFKKEWRQKGLVMTANLGLKFNYSLITTSKGDDNTASNEVNTENLFIGPFANFRLMF